VAKKLEAKNVAKKLVAKNVAKKLVAKNGTEYALTPGGNIKDRLPKRAASELSITLNGEAVKAPVTINRGWTGSDELVLTYPWFLLDGRAYYATLSPGETLEGEYEVKDGKASRADPKRVTAKVETEAGRIAAFRATWALRNA